MVVLGVLSARFRRISGDVGAPAVLMVGLCAVRCMDQASVDEEPRPIPIELLPADRVRDRVRGGTPREMSSGLPDFFYFPPRKR